MTDHMLHVTNCAPHSTSKSYRKVASAQKLKDLEKQSIRNTTPAGDGFSPWTLSLCCVAIVWFLT